MADWVISGVTMQMALELVKWQNGKAVGFGDLRCEIGKCRSQETVNPVGPLGGGLIGDITLHVR